MTRFVSALRRAPHLRITGERQPLLASFAAVFLFGLLAHGYAFTNFTVSHDSLNEMFLSGDIRYAAGSVADWKISLGRFLYPAYRTVFSGGAGTPWLSGVLSLVWVSLAVYLVSRLFSVDNALLLAVIGALFVTNVSYSALAATYIYDLDGDMLAMLLAVCAAYLLLRGTLRRRALAVIPIVGSLALYQAMISVTVSLVMIACILRLLENESAKAVFFDGLKAVGILFIGGAAYYILVRAVSSASGVALDGGYNSLLSLGRMTPDLLPEAVRSTYDTWARSTVRQPVFVPLPVTRAGHLLLAVLTLAAAACFLLRKRLPAANLLARSCRAFADGHESFQLPRLRRDGGARSDEVRLLSGVCLRYPAAAAVPAKFAGKPGILRLRRDLSCADRRARLGKYPDGKRALSQKRP